MKIILLSLIIASLFISCTKVHKLSLTGEKSIELSVIDFESFEEMYEISDKAAFDSFQKGCQRIPSKNLFYALCQETASLSFSPDFFKTFFTAYHWDDSKSENKGLLTGYYEPLLQGRLEKDANHTTPLLAPPKDLIKIYLNSVIPELKGKVVRGRLSKGRIIPYFSRAEITSQEPQDNVICWVKDKVDLFFLQVQGSGRISLENNETLFVGYGDKNGHPYKSIGKYMIKNKIMSYGQMSLQGIKKWALKHPDKIDDILNQNPSYLFFSKNQTPAKGALGVVLTPKHSAAVDTRYLPLGTPIFLKTDHPLTQKPFSSLAIAQDRGAAIKGGRRVDFFWGFGEEAAQLAGHTKSRADMFILLPKSYKVLQD